MTASGKTDPRKALIVEDDPAFGEIYDAYILDLGLPDNATDELINLVRECDPDAARKSAIVTAFRPWREHLPASFR